MATSLWCEGKTVMTSLCSGFFSLFPFCHFKTRLKRQNVGLDVEDQLQQAEGDQQAHPSGSVVFDQASSGSQPSGIHSSRRLPGPHLLAPTAAGRQPASTTTSSHLYHLHSDGPFLHFHSAAPLPVRQWTDVPALRASEDHATAGKSVPSWEPMDLWLQHEVAPWLGKNFTGSDSSLFLFKLLKTFSIVPLLKDK